MQHSVVFFVYSGVNILDLSAPLQVFSSANMFYTEENKIPCYEIKFISLEGGQVYTSSGLGILSEKFTDNHSIDTLIVPGGRVLDVIKQTEIIALIARMCKKSKRVVSICNGCFLLAEAEVLNNKKITTHWMVRDNLSERYNMVSITLNDIYLHDNGVWSSAGATAGIDLSLELVSKDYGFTLSSKVAQFLVVGMVRNGSTNQISEFLSLQMRGSFFDILLLWIKKNISKPISVRDLAILANMSERNLTRKFKTETGSTPMKTVEKVRMEYAFSLLQDASLPIKEIASKCGYESDLSFRKRFKKFFGEYPAQCRNRFRLKNRC